MYVPVSARVEVLAGRCASTVMLFAALALLDGGAASLALDSIDVRWAGNSGVSSCFVTGMVDVAR